jgi:hypothetical protein
MKAKPTALEEVAYNPETGEFTRKLFVGGRSKQPGAKVGFIKVNGYVRLNAGGRQWLGHRLAWYLMTGQEPTGDIDHINGDRSDNRSCNLRQVSRSQNMQNRGAQKNSKTGVQGVSPMPNGRFRADIKVGGKNILLGCFGSVAEAAACRAAAKAQHHIAAAI